MDPDRLALIVVSRLEREALQAAGLAVTASYDGEHMRCAAWVAEVLFAVRRSQTSGVRLPPLSELLPLLARTPGAIDAVRAIVASSPEQLLSPWSEHPLAKYLIELVQESASDRVLDRGSS